MNTKNNTLEVVKLLASFMVVFIHVPFYGEFGVVVDALARFAVPLFFLTSGYFSYHISPEKIKKRLKHVIVLFLIATVAYILFRIAVLLINGNIDGLVTYLGKYGDLTSWFHFFALNMPVSSIHLWYLSAIVYVYVIFYFVTVFRVHEKVIFFVSFSLLFLNIVLNECLSTLGMAVPVSLIRNFALMGIPFFALGLFAKKNEDKLLRIPKYAMIAAGIIGSISIIVSRYVLGKNELYIGSLLVLFAIVTFFIKYATAKSPRCLASLTGCSTYIYIFHVMVSTIFEEVYALFGITIESSVLLANLHPLITCVVSTVLAYGIVRITKSFSCKKKA